MKKSKYELLLSNELIDRIDYIAKRRGSTRSATVNRLLSEYLEIETVDSRLEKCYLELEPYFAKNPQFSNTLYLPGHSVLLIGGRSLHGLCYEVELSERDHRLEGEMRIHSEYFSEELKRRLVPFFGFIKLLESRYLAGRSIRYGQVGDVYTRSFFLEKNESLLQVGNYLGMIDRLLKGYLSGIYSERELEQEYLLYLKEGMAGI